jgi:hypothetical protein
MPDSDIQAGLKRLQVPVGRRRLALMIGIPLLSVTLALLALAVLGSQLLGPSRRNVSAELGLPLWFQDFIEQDQVNYEIHAALGTVLNAVGASPTTAAREWVKAADRAQSAGEIDAAVGGLVAAERRIPRDTLTTLCPIFAESSPWPSGLWPTARREQFAAVVGTDLSCAGSTIWGQIPDDFPISYAARPPTSGVFHNSWYPNYGVAPEPVPASAWLHNLAHGAVVLLYHCPVGCPDVVAEAAQMQADLPLGRNPRNGGASLLVTSYDDMDSPIAVVAWGQLLQLQQFDRAQIEAFFEANVDRGPECVRLVCSD